MFKKKIGFRINVIRNLLIAYRGNGVPRAFLLVTDFKYLYKDISACFIQHYDMMNVDDHQKI